MPVIIQPASGGGSVTVSPAPSGGGVEVIPVEGIPGEGVAAGGTTGQVLAKQSNADYDTYWLTSAASWGAISGTLSAQTDLQSALDGKQASGSYQPLATVLTNTTASFTTAQETKLSGIATGATANATDANLRDRTTHTGAQDISTVTGLQTALDGKQPLATVLTNTTAAFTAAQETKLAGIATGATANTGTVTSVSGAGTVSGLTLTGSVTTSGSLTLGGTLSLTSGDVTTALGFTPYNATNPSGYTTNTGTVTSVGGTGTVSGLTLTGTVTTTGNLTLGGTLAVTASNFASQTQNTFLAAPNGSSGVPTFRAIVAADVPTLNQNTTGSAATLTTSRNFSISGGGITAAAVGFNGSAAVALSASVDAGHITLARMADVATASVFYRKTAGTGAPEVQTLATLKTDLGLTGTNSGDQTITLTGDVTGSGTGSFATTIGTNKVTNAMLAQVATATFKGRTTASTGNVEDLTATQATALLDVATVSLKGLMSSSDKSKLDGIASGATANTGTVTSVAALTLGTTGTDLSSSVATGTTTPVITLNVPTASASNRGALSSTDWSTFNGKQAALVSGTSIKTVGGVSLLGSGDAGTIGVAYGGTGATTLSSGYLLKGNGTSAVSASVVYDSGTNIGIGTATTGGRLHVYGTTDATQRIIADGSGNTSSFKLQYNSSDVAFFQNYQNSEVNFGSALNIPILFYTNNTEQMRILGAGRVIIGATSGSSKLTVAGTIESTTGGIKFPDGTTQTTAAAGSSGVTDGDKGDITVSASGATWTIDSNAVSNAKLAQVATATFKGRTTAGTGNVEDLTATQATAILDEATTSLKGLMSAADKVKADAELAAVKYDATGSALGSAIADYFTSTISLEASSTYEIDAHAYFLKTTNGTVVWTWTFSNAPTLAQSSWAAGPVTGFTTSLVNGTEIYGHAVQEASTTLAHEATGSLTTAVRHSFRFRVRVRTNAATTIQLRCTESAGTVTPQAGSYMRAKKIV